MANYRLLSNALTQEKDEVQGPPRKPFSGYFHCPGSQRNQGKSWSNFMPSEICQSGCIKKIEEPYIHGNNQQQLPSVHYSTWWGMTKHFRTFREHHRNIELLLLRFSDKIMCKDLLAFPSQTQQCTPRLPLYTQRIWSNPKSSTQIENKMSKPEHNVCLSYKAQGKENEKEMGKWE